MCIYSSLCGLEAPVEGGKCRGVITYYYSRPSSSLLARPNFFVLLFYKVKRNICLRLGGVSIIRLTAKSIPCKGRVLNTLKKNLFAGKTFTKVDLSHKFTLPSTHRKTTQTCCCCSGAGGKTAAGFSISTHNLSLTHIHSHGALLLRMRRARAREVEVCCSETWTREEEDNIAWQSAQSAPCGNQTFSDLFK